MSSTVQERVPSPKTLAKKEARDKFKADLQNHVRAFEIIVALTDALAKAGEGSTIKLGNDEVISRKELRSMISAFKKSMKKLTKHAVSTKTARSKGEASSLSGVFVPIYVGPVIQEFLNGDPSGFAGPTGPSVLDEMPLAKQGYMLRNTMTMLFFLYVHKRGLQDSTNGQIIIPNAHMNNVFGGSTPSSFNRTLIQSSVKYDKSGNPLMKGRAYDKVAFAPGQELNTYELTEANDPRFNRNRFPAYYFQTLSTPNFFSQKELGTEALDFIKSVSDQLISEHEHAKAASEAWNAQIKPIQAAKRASKKKSSK